MYNPADWYWQVGTDASRLYSSAAHGYVDANDATLTAWLGAGNQPTRIKTEAELFDVLANAGIQAAGIGTVAQQASSALAGSTVSLTSTSAPTLNGTYRINASAISNFNSVQNGINAGVGLPGGGTTLPYPDASGQDHEFTAEQYTAFAAAVANYVFALIRCAQGKGATLPSSSLTIA